MLCIVLLEGHTLYNTTHRQLLFHNRIFFLGESYKTSSIKRTRNPIRGAHLEGNLASGFGSAELCLSLRGCLT